MSFLSFKPNAAVVPAKAGTLGTAFSQWILTNYGANYRAEIQQQKTRAQAQRFKAEIDASSPEYPSHFPMVGILGGGFAPLEEK